MTNNIRNILSPTKLYCPGPTPSAKNFLNNGEIYHRSESFSKTFLETGVLLQKLVQSKNTPIILSCSGTGAMEATVLNFTSENDEVLVISGGKFGERWQQICQTYNLKTHIIKVNQGAAPTANQIKTQLVQSPKIKAIFLQANETSTGTHYPIKEICQNIRQDFKGLIIVDAISALIAHELKFNQWGIDVVVGGSQKGFGVDPGLSFIAYSPRAWANYSSRPKYYFDLQKEQKGQSKGNSAFTPSIGLVSALNSALVHLDNIGFEVVAQHHTCLAYSLRSAIKELGLELFSSSPSNSLTAIKVPQNIDGIVLLKTLREEHNMIFAGGQDNLKGKIIRFSHLGFIDKFHVLDGIAALELALNKQTNTSKIGQASQKFLLEYNKIST